MASGIITIANIPGWPTPLAGVRENLDAALNSAGFQISHIEPSGLWVGDVTTAQNALSAYSGSAAQLTWNKNLQLTALAALDTTAIAAGFNYSVSGGEDSTQHAYQIDDVPPYVNGVPTRASSQSTITAMGAWAGNVVNNVAGTAPWPTSFAWQDSNNVPVPMTAAECYAFTQAAAAYVSALDMNYFTLRAEINAATSMTTLQAININSGWPSN